MNTKLLLLTALLALGIAGAAGARDRRHDHDNNPPGRAGGAGTNDDVVELKRFAHEQEGCHRCGHCRLRHHEALSMLRRHCHGAGP